MAYQGFTCSHPLNKARNPKGDVPPGMGCSYALLPFPDSETSPLLCGCKSCRSFPVLVIKSAAYSKAL